MVTKMVRHFDQDELLREFALERATYFSDNHWIQLVQEGSGKRVGELSSDTLVAFQ